MAMDVARTCMSMFAHLAARGHGRRALHAGVLAHVNRWVLGFISLAAREYASGFARWKTFAAADAAWFAVTSCIFNSSIYSETGGSSPSSPSRCRGCETCPVNLLVSAVRTSSSASALRALLCLLLKRGHRGWRRPSNNWFTEPACS